MGAIVVLEKISFCREMVLVRIATRSVRSTFGIVAGSVMAEDIGLRKRKRVFSGIANFLLTPEESKQLDIDE